MTSAPLIGLRNVDLTFGELLNELAFIVTT